MRIDLGLQQADLRIAFFPGKLFPGLFLLGGLPDQREYQTDKEDKHQVGGDPEIRKAFGQMLRQGLSHEVTNYVSVY